MFQRYVTLFSKKLICETWTRNWSENNGKYIIEDENGKIVKYTIQTIKLFIDFFISTLNITKNCKQYFKIEILIFYFALHFFCGLRSN